MDGGNLEMEKKSPLVSMHAKTNKDASKALLERNKGVDRCSLGETAHIIEHSSGWMDVERKRRAA